MFHNNQFKRYAYNLNSSTFELFKTPKTKMVNMRNTYLSLDLVELLRGVTVGRAGADLTTFFISYFTDEKAHIKASNIVGYTYTAFEGSVFTGFPKIPSLTRPQITRSVPNMLILPGFRRPTRAPATEK